MPLLGGLAPPEHRLGIISSDGLSAGIQGREPVLRIDVATLGGCTVSVHRLHVVDPDRQADPDGNEQRRDTPFRDKGPCGRTSWAAWRIRQARSRVVGRRRVGSIGKDAASYISDPGCHNHRWQCDGCAQPHQLQSRLGQVRRWRTRTHAEKDVMAGNDDETGGGCSKQAAHRAQPRAASCHDRCGNGLEERAGAGQNEFLASENARCPGEKPVKGGTDPIGDHGRQMITKQDQLPHEQEEQTHDNSGHQRSTRSHWFLSWNSRRGAIEEHPMGHLRRHDLLSPP